MADVEINPQPLPPGFEKFMEAIAKSVMRAAESHKAEHANTGDPPILQDRLICGIIVDLRNGKASITGNEINGGT